MSSRPRGAREFAERWLRRWRVPGAAVAVVERGHPTVFRSYGYRNRERRLPVTERTVFGLASVTKSFTALAILRLQEEGKLSVHDPVVRHLPEFGTPDARATRKITLHHFLTHSSGLPPLPSIYYTTVRALHDDPPFDPRAARRVGIDPDHAPIDSYAEMMEYLRTERYRLLGPPGARFSYSNEGFGLLGAVVESVTGRTHESYLEEAILRPAGMRSTTYDPGVLFRYPEVTTLYSPRRSGVRRGWVPSETWWNDSCLRACGGLRSNTEDLARYLELYLREGRVDGERIVSAASVRAMTRPYVPLEGGVSYGYGIEVRPDYPGSPIWFHSGGLPGVSSHFVVAPRGGIAGVVLTNAEGVSAPRVVMAEINARLGLPLDTPSFGVPAIVTRADHPLREYEGWFCSGEGIWARVTALGGGLRLDFRGIEFVQENLRARPAGHDRFVLHVGGAPGQVRFERDGRGRVTMLFVGHRLLRRRTPAERRGARYGRAVW